MTMMPYIKTYDIEWDETFQVKVSEETKLAAIALGAAVSDTPFDGLPILPRSKSERIALHEKFQDSLTRP